MNNDFVKSSTVNSFTEVLKTQNKFVLALFGSFLFYFLYSLYNNPIIYYSFKGFWLVLPYIGDLLLMVMKFFLPLFIIQFIVCKKIDNIIIRRLSWIIMFVFIIYLNDWGWFGSFSLTSPSDSYYWLLAQIRLLLFYYIILLLFIPQFLWEKVQMIFTFIISIALSAVPVPVVSSFVISASIVIFFILNLIAYLMLKVEENM